MLSRARLRSAFEDWKGRDITSNRLFGTGVGFLVIGVPFSLWFLIVGPTARDRLVALAFLIGSVVLALYSLWEAKHVEPGRPGRDDPRP